MKILHYPLATEKSVRLMEEQNKLVFVVSAKANKQQIKAAIEKAFDVKVLSVKTMMKGSHKRAFIAFSPETPAIDVATATGIM